MNELSEFFLFGMFGALAVGPALMNLYLATLENPRLPSGELLGYFAGELVYFGVGLLVFQFHWMRSGTTKHVLEFVAGGVLVYFAGFSLIRLGQPRAASRYVGFIRSISLVLMNPNILLIDLTLIAVALALTPGKRANALYLYGLGVVIGTAAVVALVRWNQRQFSRWRKPLEVAAAVFFLVIGVKLLMDVFSGFF